MFHQRHQRNRQTNAKTPDSKIHPRKESATSKWKITNTLIASSTRASSINKKSTANPEIIREILRFTPPQTLQLFLDGIKKKSNDNTIDPRTNKIQDTVDPRIFASDIRPALPLREKITIILVGAGVVTAVVSICSEISPGPRCL